MVPGPALLAALLALSALADPPPATPPDLNLLAPVPSPTSAARRTVECTVQDVRDDLVTATGPVASLKPMQFGRVVDANGFTVARVMIVRLREKGLEATVVDGRDRIKEGTKLRFDASTSEIKPPPGGR
jgi:hypothetical protein